MSFDKVKASIEAVSMFRRLAWKNLRRMRNHPDKDREEGLVQRMSRICILASSSRGGTAVTAELLQWQGAECVDPGGRFLTLPGEEKPHLILSRFAYPTRAEQFDDLSEIDAEVDNVSQLLEEIESEVGYPMAYCDNMELYAIQLYRRLLLQWPISFAALEMTGAIACLTQALKETFPHGYNDTLNNRRIVLATCVHCFPFIRPSFYDCWYFRAEDDKDLSGVCWSIEETPFVLPPPWHNVTAADLGRGCLLLRDPSNAWRLPFWRKIFKKQRIDILHLVRDPRESIQGLCDGWNYPFGFQTMPNEAPFSIEGYTDYPCADGEEWKCLRLNFSISKNLSQRLHNEYGRISLVQICAYQWREAHECILEESLNLGLSRTVVNFADLRENTEETLKKICDSLQMECSMSGIKYARSFPDHWVMVTPLAKHAGHDRWKISSFSTEIRALVSSGYFDEMIIKLGLEGIMLNKSDTILNSKMVDVRDIPSELVSASTGHLKHE